MKFLEDKEWRKFNIEEEHRKWSENIPTSITPEKVIEIYQMKEQHEKEEKVEIKRIDLQIARIDEQIKHINEQGIYMERNDDTYNLNMFQSRQDHYTEIMNEQMNEQYKKEVLEQYNKTKQDLLKRKEELENKELGNKEKYQLADIILRTMTIEVNKIDEEIKRQNMELKKKKLEIEGYSSGERKIPILQLYDELDSINKKIKELNDKKQKYTDVINLVKEELEVKKTEEKTQTEIDEQPRKSDTKTEQPSKSDTKTEQPSKSDTKTEQLSKPDTKTEQPSKPDTKTEQPSKPDTKTEQPSKSDTKTEQLSKPDTKTEQKNIKININKNPEIIYGNNHIRIGSLNELVKQSSDELVSKILNTLEKNRVKTTSEYAKSLKEKIEANEVDPVIIEGIIALRNRNVISEKATKEAIQAITTDIAPEFQQQWVENRAFDINYDLDSLSKGTPWSKKSRETIAEFAQKNENIATVTGNMNEKKPGIIEIIKGRIFNKRITAGDSKDNAKPKDNLLRTSLREGAEKIGYDQFATEIAQAKTGDELLKIKDKIIQACREKKISVAEVQGLANKIQNQQEMLIIQENKQKSEIVNEGQETEVQEQK